MNMRKTRAAGGSGRVSVTPCGPRAAARTGPLPLAVLLLCLFPFTCAAQTGELAPLPTPPVQRPANPKLPTVFVVGDSTANNNANGGKGWGDPFVSFFDTAKLNVLNRARAGRSSRTFSTEGLWDKVLQDLKAGDFVLIQFGHNDGGPLDTGRARGSLPGLGEETKEVTMPDGRKEVVHTFGWYNRKFINDVKAKGATPIILSLTVRNIWKDGRVERGSGQFRQWAEEIARAEGVRFVDVTNIVAERYEALGEEKVKPLFGPDHTHTSPAGAEFNAEAVVAGLKALKGDPFKNYLSARGKEVKAYKHAQLK
jgi:lysophospholipase L1-like esterase